MNEQPLTVLYLNPPQQPSGGDFEYRVRQPCEALGREPGVVSIGIMNHKEDRIDLAARADVLVIKLVADLDLLPIIEKRKKLKRPTIFEVSDNFLDFQPSNPSFRFYESPDSRACIFQLISVCDAIQTTGRELADRFAPLNGRCEVFENQLACVGSLEKPGGPLTVGWGGSAGHFDDVKSVAPALVKWLKSRPDVRLSLMCDRAFLELFAELPEGRVAWTEPGPLEKYYDFVQSLHIGLAPLLDHQFNFCRSDVKFIEYASRGVAPLCSNVPTYSRNLVHGETGLLFDGPDGMTGWLDRLAVDAAFREKIARGAHDYVARERTEQAGARRRAAFYRSLILPGASLGALKESELEASPGLQKADGSRFYLQRITKTEETLLAAMALHREGQASRAIALYRQALNDGPGGYLPALLGGSLLMAQKDLGAGFLLRKASKCWPEGCQARVRLAAAKRAEGNSAAAARDLRELQKDCPNFAPAFTAEAEMLHEGGEAKEAAECLEKALAANPYDVDAAIKLGALRLEAGRAEEAGELFERAIDIAPRYVFGHMGRGSARAGRGDFEGAAEAHLAAIAIAPRADGPAAGFLDACKEIYKAGDYQKTAALLQRAIEAAPENADLLFWLHRTLRRMGKTDEAAEVKNRLGALKSGKGEGP